MVNFNIPYEYIAKLLIPVLRQAGKVLQARRTDHSTAAVTTVELVGLQCEKIEHTLGNSNLQIGDWKILFTSVPAPKKADRIVLNDGPHVIVDVEEIAPNGVVLAYWGWARRG